MWIDLFNTFFYNKLLIFIVEEIFMKKIFLKKELSEKKILIIKNMLIFLQYSILHSKKNTNKDFADFINIIINVIDEQI